MVREDLRARPCQLRTAAQFRRFDKAALVSAYGCKQWPASGRTARVEPRESGLYAAYSALKGTRAGKPACMSAIISSWASRSGRSASRWPRAWRAARRAACGSPRRRSPHSAAGGGRRRRRAAALANQRRPRLEHDSEMSCAILSCAVQQSLH